MAKIIVTLRPNHPNTSYHRSGFEFNKEGVELTEDDITAAILEDKYLGVEGLSDKKREAIIAAANVVAKPAPIGEVGTNSDIQLLRTQLNESNAKIAELEARLTNAEAKSDAAGSEENQEVLSQTETEIRTGSDAR